MEKDVLEAADKEVAADKYKIKIKLFVYDYKTWCKDKKAHQECDAKAHATLLQHCAPVEEETLKADSR